MEIMQAELFAKLRYLVLGFMVARNDMHASGPLPQHLPTSVQIAREIREIPRADVVIGIDLHQRVKRIEIAVNVGEEENLHATSLSPYTWHGCSAAAEEFRAIIKKKAHPDHGRQR